MIKMADGDNLLITVGNRQKPGVSDGSGHRRCSRRDKRSAATDSTTAKPARPPDKIQKPRTLSRGGTFDKYAGKSGIEGWCALGHGLEAGVEGKVA